MLRIRNWNANFETHESRKLKRLEWVSVPNDLLDIGYRTLIDHPNGAAHFGAWMVMIEVGSTCKIRGTLSETGVPLTERHLAMKSGLPAELFEGAIPRLLDIGRLEEIPDTPVFSPVMPGESPDAPADSPESLPESWEISGETSAYRDRDRDRDKNNKTICASDDARTGGSSPPLDDPPFGTTEPDALFPTEARTPPVKLADGLTPQQETWFAAWWTGFWLHKARKAARRAFGKQVKTASRFEQVMSAMQAQAPEMLTREPQHRPHGATWLNGARWEDEPVGIASRPQGQRRDVVSIALGEAMAKFKSDGENERQQT